MAKLRIYVASSWKNPHQPDVVSRLRAIPGTEVYDFRHPKPGNDGFAWEAVDPNWEKWTFKEYRAALEHPIAQEGFRFDQYALEQCDMCVLVLPCGRSSHLELGYCAGMNLMTAVYSPPGVPVQPELMNLLADRITDDFAEIEEWVQLTIERVAAMSDPPPKKEKRDDPQFPQTTDVTLKLSS